MHHDFDIIVLGMGPAGMAVSAMGSEMGLKVCSIEPRALGGECMNIGCIPSKALLRAGKLRWATRHLAERGLTAATPPELRGVFSRLQEDLRYIGENKTSSMFSKVELVLQKGRARFVDPHTVEVGGRRISGRRIFIAVGTAPMVPQLPGLKPEECLTNENLFSLSAVPDRLVVWGGGAIACEMAQAFSRLGSKVEMIIRAPHLLRRQDPDAVALLEKTFAAEGITIHAGTTITKIEDGRRIFLENGTVLESERLLVALGRRRDYRDLNLEAAGVAATERGITVNGSLQTSVPHIFAIGDCNGYHEFSHAAMHQGMTALMNCLLPRFGRLDFRRYVVPAAIFTEPQISQVGLSHTELEKSGRRHEVIRVNYSDYGAAIAEGVDQGFVKVFVSPSGKVLGAVVAGEGSGEMINEWALAVQKGVRIHSIMMLQHSFPTMSFLNKRIAETWMMGKVRAHAWMRRAAQFMFRLGD